MIKNGSHFPADSTTLERYFSPALRRSKALSPTTPLSGVQAVIHDRIWNALLGGKLKPGMKLPEEQIGMIFKVSRTVVRKVLIVMEQEGIVSLLLNRGAYIVTPTPEKIYDVLEATQLVACYIVEKLASKYKFLSEDDKARLAEHNAAQRSAIEEQDFQAARRLSLEFLLLLATVHQNKIFASLQEQAMSHIVLAMLMNEGRTSERALLEIQLSILEFMAMGKKAEAGKAMNEYLDVIRESLNGVSPDRSGDLRSILSEGLDLSRISKRGRLSA